MKKLFAIVLTLAMLFSLVACGGNNATTNNTSGNSTSSNSTDATDNTDGGEGTG